MEATDAQRKAILNSISTAVAKAKADGKSLPDIVQSPEVMLGAAMAAQFGIDPMEVGAAAMNGFLGREFLKVRDVETVEKESDDK